MTGTTQDTMTISRRSMIRTMVAGSACLALGHLGVIASDASATEATLAALSSAQAEYAAAMAELQSISEQLEIAQYNLAECQANLEATNNQISSLEESIAQKQAELLEAQEVLASRIGSSYRAGTSSMLEVLLGASDFEDFVSRLYYANKVSDADAAAIENVRTIRDQLEEQEAQLVEQRAYQEQLLFEQQQITDGLVVAEEHLSAYTSSLSSEVLALMAQAQEEERARQQAEYEAWLAEQNRESQGGSPADPPAQGGGSGSDSGSGGGSDSDGDSDPVYPEPEPEPEPDPGYEEPSYGGGGNHVYSVADIAWNYCGVPYVYGGSDPSGFDCSGLAQYCYAMAGYSIGRTTYAQADNISSRGQMVYSMSQLSPGDLIFPHSGHVGIYEGGGCLIDAPYPGQVVQYRSCWFSDCFGGCPV